jgi:hypothetical protein
MKEITFTNFKPDQTVEHLDVEYHSRENGDEQIIIKYGNWSLEIDRFLNNPCEILMSGLYKDDYIHEYVVQNRGDFIMKVLDNALILDCISKEDDCKCILLFNLDVGHTYISGLEYTLYTIIDERCIALFRNEEQPLIVDCFSGKKSRFYYRKDNVCADEMGEPYDYKDYHLPFELEPTEYLKISPPNDSSFKVVLKRVDCGWDEPSSINSYEYTFKIDYTDLRLLLTDCREVNLV